MQSLEGLSPRIEKPKKRNIIPKSEGEQLLTLENLEALREIIKILNSADLAAYLQSRLTLSQENLVTLGETSASLPYNFIQGTATINLSKQSIQVQLKLTTKPK